MTSLKDRQRAAARAKLEREMAARQEQAVKRRQRTIWSASVAGAVVVVVALVAILVSATGHKAKPTAATASKSPAGPATCVWTPNPNPSASPAPNPSATPNKDLVKTGTPPTTDIPNTGTSNFVIDTTLGNVTVALDRAKAPCASESLAFLSSKKFYDNTKCANLITGGPYVLMCGDPSGKGDGGPNYSFTPENLPTDQRPNYAEGDVAMLNNGSGNGSQFMFIYQDTPVQTDPSTNAETPAIPSQYTIVGHVTAGMDIISKIAAAGAEKADATGASAPKLKFTITSTTVGSGASATP